MAKLEPLNIRIILATRRPLLLAIGLGLIGVVLILTLVVPQSQEVYSLIGQINALKPKTTQLKKKLASLDNISSIAEYAQVDVVDGALPSKKPLLELLKSLSNVSQITGARIMKFELAPGVVASDSAALQKAVSKNDKGYESLKVTLKVSGSFQQLQDFLIQMEKASPFTTVTEMHISGQLDQTIAPDTQFQADITTDTYFFTQPISVRVETPLPLIGDKERSVLAALTSFVPTNLQTQKEVLGGGLEDLFGVKSFDSETQVEALLNKTTPSPTPTAQPEAIPGQGAVTQ